jgi:hypothetical protein
VRRGGVRRGGVRKEECGEEECGRRSAESRRESCEGSREAFTIEVRLELLRIHEAVVQVVDVRGVVEGVGSMPQGLV